MYAAENPGCSGAAARLPKKPGSQKLTPPSSARAAVDAAMKTPSTIADAAAVPAIRHVAACRFITASPARTRIAVSLACRPGTKKSTVAHATSSPSMMRMHLECGMACPPMTRLDTAASAYGALGTAACLIDRKESNVRTCDLSVTQGLP